MTETRGRVDRKAVACFYALACAISWPFLWWYAHGWESWKAPIYLKIATFMWGPGLAAITSLATFRRNHRRTITLFGTSAWRSTVFLLAPISMLAAAHAPDRGGRVAGAALFLGLVGSFNALGEELGWRGFLQDALRPVRRVGRYILIGALWEVWHFRFATGFAAGQGGGAVVLNELVLCGVLTVLSWVIGEATDRSRSLIVAMSLHFWVDAVFQAPTVLGVGPLRTHIVAGLSVVLWAWLLWTWRRSGEPAGRPI
jgi:membrane protease YdiL (CAAX protease family)